MKMVFTDGQHSRSGKVIKMYKSAEFINDKTKQISVLNRSWWPENVRDRNKGELSILIISEICECMEGERKNLQDDHLPHRKMAEVEMADTAIVS